MAKITENSNEILDLWANTCPKKIDENSSEEDKKDCEKFKDKMKTCVTCKSTIRRDLNMLNTNWKYVERDGINVMNTIKNRRTFSKKIKKTLKSKIMRKLMAQDVYDYIMEIYSE